MNLSVDKFLQNNISYKANLQSPQMQTATPVSTDKPDVVDIKSQKKKRILTYTSVGAAILLILTMLLNRKKLAGTFNKNAKTFDGTQTTRPASSELGRTSSQNISGGQSGSQIETIVENIKPKTPELTAEKYKELTAQWYGLPPSDAKRIELKGVTDRMKAEMIEKNISFVPKPPTEFASKQEEISFAQKALSHTENEASIMDALDYFDRFGGNYETSISDGINDLTVFTSEVANIHQSQIADKVFARYTELFNKHADRGPNNTSARHISWLIRKHQEVMSGDTIIKFIETLKDFSFEKAQADTIRNYVFDSEFKKRPQAELDKIDKHLKELEELVKDMPYNDKTR